MVFAQVTPLEGAIKQRQLQSEHSLCGLAADEMNAENMLGGFVRRILNRQVLRQNSLVETSTNFGTSHGKAWPGFQIPCEIPDQLDGILMG